MFPKVVYTDDVTVINAQNLNDIQDAIIQHEADIDGVEEDLESITADTRNLWKLGDAEIVNAAYKMFTGLNIPAGTYTLSALITDNDNDPRNCRATFYKNTHATANRLAQPYIAAYSRNSVVFTLAEPANIVLFQYGASQTLSGTATWHDIQIEAGNTVTPYIPPYTAADYVCRENLNIESGKISTLETLYDRLNGELSDLSEQTTVIDNRTKLIATRNLWGFGDQTFVASLQKNINLLSGMYVLSGRVISQAGNAINARVDFRAGTTTIATAVLSTGGGRSSALVDLTESAIDNIRLFSSNTEGNSSGLSATYSEIQIESGDCITPYIPPLINEYSLVSEKESDVLYEVNDISITGNKYFYFLRGKRDLRNIKIECVAKWEGNEADEYHVPQIRFDYGNLSYPSCYYNIGSKSAWKENYWRMPPMPYELSDNAFKNRMNINLRVPSGLTLTIQKLVVRYDESSYRPHAGLRVDTHGSFMYYPQHSIYALNGAVKCGASRFITIPKISSDGVWFAYHDDTFDESTTILRNADGSAITNSGYQGKSFNQIPWTWLKTLDSCIYQRYYAGMYTGRLMKISEMLEVCNATGVWPVFSWHPASSLAETQNMRELVEKYGLLDKLTILPGEAFLRDVAFPTFGNDIEMYKTGTTLGNGTLENVQQHINFLETISGLDKKKVCIAVWVPDATPEIVELIRDSGYLAGLHAYSHTTVSGLSNTKFSAGDYKYWQSLGVTVFTDGGNPSLGLNWI